MPEVPPPVPEVPVAPVPGVSLVVVALVLPVPVAVPAGIIVPPLVPVAPVPVAPLVPVVPVAPTVPVPVNGLVVQSRTKEAFTVMLCPGAVTPLTPMKCPTLIAEKSPAPLGPAGTTTVLPPELIVQVPPQLESVMLVGVTFCTMPRMRARPLPLMLTMMGAGVVPMKGAIDCTWVPVAFVPVFTVLVAALVVPVFVVLVVAPLLPFVVVAVPVPVPDVFNGFTVVVEFAPEPVVVLLLVPFVFVLVFVTALKFPVDVVDVPVMFELGV